jgi:hypothetical protein
MASYKKGTLFYRLQDTTFAPRAAVNVQSYSQMLPSNVKYPQGQGNY